MKKWHPPLINLEDVLYSYFMRSGTVLSKKSVVSESLSWAVLNGTIGDKHGLHRGNVQFLDCIIPHFKIADSVLPFRFNLDVQYSQMHYSETVNDIEIKHIFILILHLEWWGVWVHIFSS
jgi:hypothetical protein